MTNLVANRLWKRVLWIAAFAALAYLPAALQLTYYRDDWYYAYDAMVGPAGVFRYMFAEDRPARGPLFELYHALFGIAPTPYHLAMLFWRITGGAAVTWLFQLLWPRRVMAALMAGVLFALYPGFTWWVQGIEYQPMVASAALMLVSLAMTVLAIRQQTAAPRIAALAGAILTGWMYLAFVEYAAGMEILRILLIILAADVPASAGPRPRLVSTLRLWLPYLIIPVGFILWRFFVFASERKATDLGLQLGALLADPLTTGFSWLIGSLLSVFSVALAAWVHPLLTTFFSLGLRAQLLGLVLALPAAALTWWLFSREAITAKDSARSDDDWQLQSIWLGMFGIALGIAPIIVANRQITLPRFSHYALPASLGVAFLVVGLAALISNRRVQAAVLSLLVGLSILTHQGLGAAAVHEQRTIAAFWHQMAWRAPSIESGTTLLVLYPGIDYGTDSDVVWGPANFIYYPDSEVVLPVDVAISALTLDPEALNSVLSGKGAAQATYRAHSMIIDPGNVLIAVQSANDGCVRVLDARWPTFSVIDSLVLRALADTSRAQNILPAASVLPPAPIFGAEPPHTWCYYFELASLAAQRGEWERVATLQSEAATLGLHPNDQIEWMPFLQAQAFLGDERAVKDISTRVNTERLYRQQACSNLRAMGAHVYPLAPAMQTYVDELFCGGGQ